MEKKVYDEQRAKDLLRGLGIHSYFRGYQLTLLALRCVAENGDSLSAMNKEIYFPISESLRCNIATVEAGIRRTSERSWNNNPKLVNKIVYQELDSRPRVRQFLEGLFILSCDSSANKEAMDEKNCLD